VERGLQQDWIQNANGDITLHTYDAFGRLDWVGQKDDGGPCNALQVTLYDYNTIGNLTQVTRGGQVCGSTYTAGTVNSHMTYDGAGRKLSMNDPDMGDWHYQYDPAGNLIVQIDANDYATDFYYDALTRLLGKTYSAGAVDPQTYQHPSNTNCATYVVCYTYDTAANGIGQLAQIRWETSLNNGGDTFIYDTLGRLNSQTRWLDGFPYTLNTTSFDTLHRPLTVQYPDSEVVTLSYDHEGENGLTAGSTTLVSNITYNSRGQMTYLDRGALGPPPGGIGVPDTTYNYHPQLDSSGGGSGDSNFRLSQIVSGNLANFTYQYDQVGNITQISDDLLPANKTQSFTYDHLGRLKTAETPAAATSPYKHTYAYDLLGNIQSRGEYQTDCTPPPCTWEPTPIPYNYTYDPNHVHAVTSAGSGTDFDYDANGNMTIRTDSTGSFTQAFDRENRLTSVTNNATTQVTQFLYDASGQRVKTIQPDGTVIYTPFPNYEVSVKPDTWQTVSPFTANGYNSSDTPGWTMASSDTPGWYLETPANLSWTSTRTYPGTTTLQGSDYKLDNLATGTVQSSPISVTPGDAYTLSVWVKGELNGNASSGSAKVSVNMGVPGLGFIWSSSNYSNTTWQQVQGSFTVPAGVNSITIELAASQINGWIAFDNLTLADKNGNVPISNHSFESGVWAETPSADYPATSLWRGYNGPATAQHGSFSYVLSNLGHSTLTSPFFGITPGGRTASVWVKGAFDAASSAGELRLEALYFNVFQEQIWSQTVWVQTSFSNPDWQQLGGLTAAPVGSTWMKLRLVSEFNNLSVAVDDVTLTGVSVPDGDFELGNVWSVASHTEFPASAIAYGGGGRGGVGSEAYTFTNAANGYFESAAITARPNQRYEVQALVSGELNDTAATGNGRLQIDFYNSQNGLISSWNSIVVLQDGSSTQGGYFTTPANTATLKLRLVADKTNGWLTFDDVTLTSQSAAVSSGPGQNYDLSAWVRGVVSAPVGQLGGKIRVNFYNSSGNPVGTPAVIWSSSNYNQTGGNGQQQSGSFTTPAGTATFRVGLEVHVDNGWLDIDDITLTGWSAPVSSGGNRNYDISALVSGNVTAAAGQGGRLLIRYTPAASDFVAWQNILNYNSPSGTTQSNNFTTPANTTSFKVGYEVRLDNGWLGFDVIKLTGYSGSVNSSGDRTYELSALVSGVVSAPLGEGGQMRVSFTPAGPGPITLWSSPANYNSPGGTTQTSQFTTPAGTTSLKVGYEIRLDNGYLNFSNLSLKELIRGTTTRRNLYSLAGQTIAQRQKQENSTPQMADTFSDNNAVGWTAHNGSWSLVATTPNGYAYQQTNTSSSATNSYYNLTQNSATSYSWKMTFQSSNRKAGLYFFGSNATDNTYHGYSYSVWQTETQLQICENMAGSSSCNGSTAFTAANGQSHTYRVIYDPATGRIDVWRNGIYALSRTDSSPLTSGNHLAFKTQNSSVRFDDVRVTTFSSNLYYFFSDHLGSTTTLSDANGELVPNSTARYLPFGDWRTEPTANLTDRGFTGHLHNNIGTGADDIGLIYMQARWYLPSIGRFASADTIIPNPTNPQSYNRFSYAYNNPVNLVDPSGHCAGGTTNNPFNDAGEIIHFDCTFDDFESLSIAVRLRWIQQMMSQGMGGKLANWFNNIAGIIQSYQDFDLAHSGSWLSNVNAGILQGIQDGYALWSGTAYYSSLNPGGEAWKVFFTEQNKFEPNETDLIRLWGVAEETSTNFGVGMATYKNILPNITETWFLGISKVYRLANAQFGGNLAPVGAFTGAVIDGLSGTENGQMALSLAVEQFADPRTLWGPNNDIAPVRYFATYFVWGPQAVFQNASAAWSGTPE
jgi:RHS repeat-associated protein